ncbi:hypothetical protein [Gloeobacter morelensis]|nr:hypothetical protein [Gloeobacter morelensis]
MPPRPHDPGEAAHDRVLAKPYRRYPTIEAIPAASLRTRGGE